MLMERPGYQSLGENRNAEMLENNRKRDFPFDIYTE